MRYIIDRPQMLKLIFGESGRVGNDLYAINDPDYNHSIPQRSQDLGMAKSLLKKAGRSGLNVQLVVAAVAAGVPQEAQIFAEQARGAGVTVGLRTVTPTEYFGPNYLKWPFSMTAASTPPYLTDAAEGVGPGAPYNETHFSNPRYNGLFREASGKSHPVKQRELVHEMQLIEWNEGG